MRLGIRERQTSLSRQAKISAERDLKGRRVKNFSRVSTFPSQQKAEGTVLFFRCSSRLRFRTRNSRFEDVQIQYPPNTPKS